MTPQEESLHPAISACPVEDLLLNTELGTSGLYA